MEKIEEKTLDQWKREAMDLRIEVAHYKHDRERLWASLYQLSRDLQDIIGNEDNF